MCVMRANDVVAIYNELAASGVPIWIDGGWAVDALLGEQTRPHADLDIALEVHHLSRLVAYLSDKGYRPVDRDDYRPWNFVLGDPNGNEVDIHVIEIDAAGNGIYGPPENGEMYPAGALAGRGTIAGQSVWCIAARFLVEFHTGYPLGDTDIHDVTALCSRFGIPLPEEYRRLLER
jgi:lincosamide nucleotidyltransferase A/C/D/E